MNYIEKTRSDGEEIIKLFNINRFMYWNSYFIMFFGIMLFVAGFISPFEDKMFNILFWVAGLMALFVGVYMYLSLSSINMGITNKRVVVKEGIVSIGTQEIRLQAIETIDVQQTILGRMLGYGTVKVTGKGDSIALFKDVDNPLDIKRTIESVLSKYGERKIEDI